MKIEMVVIVLVIGLLGMTQAGSDAVQDELTTLGGEYRMLRGEEGGQPLSPEVVRSAKLTLTGDRHVVQLGEETIRGTHTVDALEAPKTIAATDTTGRFAGKTVKGIYRFAAGEFMVSFAPPGEPRPTDFNTQDKPGGMLHVWKRMR